MNTPSPYNIIGPRYFDALALGSPVICPNHNFYKFYFQRDDLIVFKSIGEFEEKFKFYSENQNHLKLLSDKVKEVFLYGSGDEEIKFRYDEGGRIYQVSRTFEGVIPNMERRYRETDSNWIREEFENYQNNQQLKNFEI